MTIYRGTSHTLLQRWTTSGRGFRFGIVVLSSLALIGSGVGVVQALTPRTSSVPISNLTQRQAADVQSVVNVWHAYAADLDSNNVEGVASLMTPSGGYTFQKDTQTMAPSACQPQPGATASCIPDGGCVALGYNGIQQFLPGVGYTPEHSWAGSGQHQLGNPVVKLSSDSRSATLYMYFNFGRYIVDMVSTTSGWKVQWERIVWQDVSRFPCHVDWSSDNKPGLLGTDLYYLKLPVGGPQISTDQATNPSYLRANSLVDQAVVEVNAGHYEKSCDSVDNLVAYSSRAAAFDTTHRNYLRTIAQRFLADAGCHSLTPPDRTASNGTWAAAAAWAAYEMSGQPGLEPIPTGVPPFSAVSGLL